MASATRKTVFRSSGNNPNNTAGGMMKAKKPAPKVKANGTARKPVPKVSKKGTASRKGERKTQKQKPSKPRKSGEDSLPWEEQTIEARLCRAASSGGGGCVPIDYVTSMPERMKKFKLKAKDITPEVIRKAQAIDRQWDIHTKNIVLEMGGSWNGERKQVRVYPEDQAILGWLRSHRAPASRMAIVLNTDLKSQVVQTALQRLVPRGIVTKTGEGKYAAR